MIATEFARSGRVWLRGAIAPEQCQALARACSGGNRRIASGHPVLDLDALWLPHVTRQWDGMRVVRAVAFDKQAETNWAVPWHQDRVIAVADRHEVPGFANWSRKGGVWHCEPPMEILDQMLFVRVHLDPCDAESGAMEIALGSHHAGPVRAEDAEAVAAAYPAEVTEAAAGDILVMHMLMLHRSRPSRRSAPRRVLRFDLARAGLPGPLDWAL